MNNQNPYCLVFNIHTNIFSHSICYGCDAELLAMGFLVVKRFKTLEEAEIAHAQKNLLQKAIKDIETNKGLIKKRLHTSCFIGKHLLLLSLSSLETIKN